MDRGNASHQKSKLFSQTAIPTRHEAVRFLRSCDALIRNLNIWFELLQQSENGPVWWYKKVSTPSGTQQNSFIEFSNPGIPGMMQIYWAGLLELSKTILEIRCVLAEKLSHKTLVSTLGQDSPSLSLKESRLTKLALRICQAAIELALTIEGSSIAYLAVTFADHHFRQLLESNPPNDDPGYSHESQRHEMAQIGLECSQKALEKLDERLGFAGSQD